MTLQYNKTCKEFPTGGKAHEPQGMIRCNSEADSKVWMKEDTKPFLYGCDRISGSEAGVLFQSFFMFKYMQMRKGNFQ